MFSWKNKSIDLENVDKRKLFNNAGAYGLLTLAVGAMAFFGMCQPSQNNYVGPKGAAATVAGHKISSTEFRRSYIQVSSRYRQQFKDNYNPVAMGVSSQVLKQLVSSYVLAAEASKNGIGASEDDVVRVIQEGKYFQNEQGQFDPKLFKNFLNSQGYTEKSFSNEIKRSLVSNKVRAFITDTFVASKGEAKLSYMLDETKYDVSFLKLDPVTTEIVATETQIAEFTSSKEGKDQIKTYYDTHQSDYSKAEQVKARHILIGYKGATRAVGDAANRSKADAKKKADKVAKEAKSKKSSFASLAKKYTDEPGGKAKGGDLGWFDKTTMVEQFSEVAFKLNENEVSGVVETPFGYHIIMVEEKKDAKNNTIEEVSEEIAVKIITKDQKPEVIAKRADEVLEALKQGNSAKALLNKYDLEWQQSGDFPLSTRFLPEGLGSDAKVKSAVYGLKKKGDLSNVVSVGDVKYILKLKSVKKPNMSKLTEKKLDELADSKTYMGSYWLYNAWVSSAEKDYEKKGLIYKNPDFENYDSIMEASQRTGS